MDESIKIENSNNMGVFYCHLPVQRLSKVCSNPSFTKINHMILLAI